MRDLPAGNLGPGGRNYVLTVVLGSYQGQQFPLNGAETVIGREEGADIVFKDSTISRKHVKVVLQGDEVYFEDLGSTNGTFVDGKRITRQKVKLGDLIVVGSNMVNVAIQPSGPSMRVNPLEAQSSAPAGPVLRVSAPAAGIVGPTVRLATPADIPAAAAGGGPIVKIANPMLESALSTGSRKPVASSSMSGQIEQIPLSDLIQLLATSSKSGVLEVRDGDELGRLYLNEGRIEYAAIEDCPKTSPKRAFCRILLWKRGTFDLLPPTSETFEAKINDPVDILLLEAMRHQDEHERLPGEKPDLNSILSVSAALDKPFHTLSPNHLNMVQLILNHRKVRRILYHSPLPDYETYRILLELIKDGFVKHEPPNVENAPIRLVKTA